MPRTLEFQNRFNLLNQQMKELKEEMEFENYYLFRNKVKRESINHILELQLVSYSHFDDIILNMHMYDKRDEYWGISEDIYTLVYSILNNLNETSIIKLFEDIDINRYIPIQHMEKNLRNEDFFNQLQFIYFFEGMFYFIFNINYNEDIESFPLLYFAINIGEVYRDFNQKFINGLFVKAELDLELLYFTAEEVIEFGAELIFQK